MTQSDNVREARKRSLQLMGKMAKAEGVATQSFSECKALLEKDSREPMKSMQKKYGETAVFTVFD